MMTPEGRDLRVKPEDKLNRANPEKTLIRAGWEKQATYDEPRLSEIVETYKEIGLEVHLETFNPDNAEGCTDCMMSTPEKFKTIYTRKKPKTN
jgi:hypothetical protein